MMPNLAPKTWLMIGAGTTLALGGLLISIKGRPAFMMNMSRKGIEHLITREGVRYQVYDDATGGIIGSYEEASGYPTIGVGHLIPADQYETFRPYLSGGKELTKGQVRRLLRKDLPRYEPKKMGLREPITQEMFDSLTHMAFNVGPNASAVKRTVEAINNKDWEGASEAIRSGPTTSKGRTVPSLIERRNLEADWFLRGGEPSALAPITPFIWIAMGVVVIGSIYEATVSKVGKRLPMMKMVA